MKRILRSTYYGLVILVFLLIAAAGLTQTKTFRSYVRTLAIARLESLLRGTVEFDAIEGNLATGLQINNVRIRKNGREIFFAERIEATYDAVAFFFQRASFSRITLLKPRIRLWRTVDKEWNIEQLLPPSTSTDTSSSNWTLDFRQLELLGASVSVVDSFALSVRTAEEWESHPSTAFDYADFHLDPLTLQGAVKVQGDEIALTVRNFGFQSAQPRFTLSQLSGEFLLNPRTTEIRQLSIRIPATSLKLDAKLEGTNILTLHSIGELEHAPASVNLSVDKLDFRTLKQFLPGPVDFLENQASIDLKASGTFGHLTVNDFQLRTPRSYLRIKGKIDNLHVPRQLELDLAAEDNILHPADALELLPGLHLPDLRSIGVLSCTMHFKGRPNHFSAIIDGELGAGLFTLNSTMDLRQAQPLYEGSLVTYRLDLAQLGVSEDLQSSLNLHGTFSGSGTRPRDMTALFRIQIDSSTFHALPVRQSVLVVDIADRAARTNLLLNAGTTRVDLNGLTRFQAADSVAFSLKGNVSSFNLADVLPQGSPESDISFEVDADGTALRFVPIRSRAEIRFLRSSFNRETFENKNLLLNYDGRDSLQRSLVLRSDPVDIDVKGAFSPPALVETIQRGAEILAGALSHRFDSLDSLQLATQTQKPARREPRLGVQDSLQANIVIAMKDFHPLGVFLGEPMRGNASLQATMTGTLRDLTFAGDVRTDQFTLASGNTTVGIAGGKARFTVGHLGVSRTLENLSSTISLEAQQMLYDSVRLSGVKLDHQLEQDSSQFYIRALVDSTIGLDMTGSSFFVPNRIRIHLARLQTTVADYAFENSEPIDIMLGKDGMVMSNFVLQRDAETITLHGRLDPSGYSDLRFSVENFLLKNLQDFSHKESYLEKVRDFNGILDASGTFGGNFRVPRFDVSLLARGVTVGPTVFGQISGNGSYADGMSNVFLEFRNNPEERTAEPEMVISGRMPLQLGSVSASRSVEGMDLSIRSRGFRMEFLDPFIPVTRNLTGRLEADLRMKGTLSEPLYEGSLTVKDARFVFSPLGITYQLNGVLLPQDRRISLQNVILSNIDEDRVAGVIDGLGSMNLGGTFTLEGLQVRDFEFTANGQLLIMKEDSRLANLPLYGNVYVASRAGALRWVGSPEHSLVSGNLLIKNANITFPPSREVLLERSRLFDVVFVDDTTHIVLHHDDQGTSTVAASLGSVSDLLPLRADLSPSNSPPAPADHSFLDNINYNLAVEMAGLTQVRFVFNQLTNEELFADLKGRLVFTKDQTASRVTGELEVGQRSYYKYFKTLQATGKLLFTGDISNPELDITATYEGTYQPDTTRIGLSEQDKQDQKVIVRLTITGTREEPKVKMGLEVYDREGNKKQQRADAQSDAIAFLVSGRFKDEMTQPQQTSLTTSLLSSIGSSLLSGPLTDFVRSQIGYVTSVDVVYSGGLNRSFQQAADLRITGEVGDAVIRLGGRVLTGDLSNANVSVQFPMSSVVGSEAWRNLILEIERRVEGVESIEQRRPSNGLRLLYRITF